MNYIKTIRNKKNIFYVLLFATTIFQNVFAGAGSWICRHHINTVAAGEYKIAVISDNPKVWSEKLNEALLQMIDIKPDLYQGVKFIPIPLTADDISSYLISSENNEVIYSSIVYANGSDSHELFNQVKTKIDLASKMTTSDKALSDNNVSTISPNIKSGEDLKQTEVKKNDLIVVNNQFVDSHSQDATSILNASKHIALAVTARASKSRAPMLLKFPTEHLLKAANFKESTNGKF